MAIMGKARKIREKEKKSCEKGKKARKKEKKSCEKRKKARAEHVGCHHTLIQANGKMV